MLLTVRLVPGLTTIALTDDFYFYSFLSADSTDIVDCKLKLILGLIWTLILHYSISVPMWDGEDEKQLNGSGTTPKQRYVSLGSLSGFLLILFLCVFAGC